MAPVTTDPLCHFRDDNRAQAPTGHKPEDLETKLKLMPIFTTVIKKSKGQLVLRFAHTILTHG